MKGRTMPRRTWNGKFPEEFDEKDTLAFMAQTDVLVHGEVTGETLDAIQKAGYAYENGMVVKPSICGALKETAADMPGCGGLEYQSRVVEKGCGKGRASPGQASERGEVT